MANFRLKSIFLVCISILLNLSNSMYAKDNSIESDSLRNLAKTGDINAQLELGREFFFGINRVKNYNLSFYYFNKAANAGSIEGKFNVGICYEFGYGVEPSSIIAYHYYKEAIALDEAKFKVATVLYDGLKGEKVGQKYYRAIAKDYEESQLLINELIKSEYAPALVWKAEELLKSKDLNDESLKYIFSLLDKASAKNDLKAKELLIECYLKGIGTNIDERKAFSLAEDLYKLGYAKISAKLALFYEFGIGVAPDMDKALTFYKVASENGEGFAKIKMADNYLSGFYLPSDMQKAIEIYQDELKKDNTLAYLRLADCYLKGVGLEKNSVLAFNYYLKAAGRGEVEAQYKLAQLFRDGIGTRVDKGAVFFWLKQGAMRRNVDCMREVAECYIKGFGTEKDLDMAKELLIEASNMGDERAKQLFYEEF